MKPAARVRFRWRLLAALAVTGAALGGAWGVWALQRPVRLSPPTTGAELRVYFVRDAGTYFTLEPVTRTVSLSEAGDEALLEVALTVLREGPTGAERARGLRSAFPPDARLHALRVEGGEVAVDLNAAFAAGGGTALMQGRLFQLLYTLSEPETVSQVWVAIEGERVRAFSGEGILLEQPWRRPSGGLPRW
jgi:spore germination protein GerM